MKRRIASMLSALLLCLAISGCQAETAQTKKLWVVTDLGYDWSLHGKLDLNQERADRDFQAILDYFGGLPEDMEVELEILPVKDEDLNARLTRLKTEILAGGGPDVFLLTCDNPGYSFLNQERLFPNPEKAMYSGFFLPLDEYIENARFMEWDKLTPVVMSAGRTEEGQMLLPFCYDAGVVSMKKEFLGEKPPASWDEAVTRKNPVIQKGYGWVANNMFPNVFPKLVDNRTEELLISKEELLHRVNQVLSCPDSWSDYPVEVSHLFPNCANLDFENIWEKDLENTVFLPMRNTDGGYTAYITYYGAVNRNTEFPQEAFTVLDMFLSKQVLRREPFGGAIGDGSKGRGIYLFSNFGTVPVHEDLPLGSGNSVDGFSCSKEAFQNFDSLRKEIIDVYFPSDIERTVGETLDACYIDYRYPKSKEEVEKLVFEAYDRVWMMLGES